MSGSSPSPEGTRAVLPVPVHRHPKISDTHIQNLTDLARFKFLDFSQHERLPLIERHAIHATANVLANLLGKEESLKIGWWRTQFPEVSNRDSNT